MISLIKYLFENKYVCEGGAAGHMAHPYDYTDFALRDFKDLIKKLLTGQIKDITEKVDGVNIVATMNPQGEIVFIRNKGDLNSERGGMTINDMVKKWSDNPEIIEKFVSGAHKIESVLKKFTPQFFNIDSNTRRAVNCECVIEGKTNIMPYASSQVYFHNFFIYSRTPKGWEHVDTNKDEIDKIQHACDDIENVHITPNVVFDTVKLCNKRMDMFIKDLSHIWKDAGCKETDTVDDWKRRRFRKFCNAHEAYKEVGGRYNGPEEILDWVLKSEQGFDLLYNRWFNNDKSVNIKKIRELYPDDVDKLDAVDKKDYKTWVRYVMEPLDFFFSDFGNLVLCMYDGYINSGMENKIVDELRKDIKDTIEYIRKNGSVEANDKLNVQIKRLENLGNKINPVEGIVFSYKGRVQKITGSFAALNQLINIKRLDR